MSRHASAPAADRTAAGAAPGGLALGVARETGLALVTLGVVLFLFVAYQLWGTGFTERHDQSVLQQQFQKLHVETVHHDTTATTAPSATTGDSPVVGSAGGSVAAGNPATDGTLTPSPPSGSAIDHLVIPSIGVDKYVVQGVAEQDLSEGPGHYLGTPLPGQRGNVGIAGHRTTYGAPFFELGKLKRGAWIYLTDTAGHTFDYRVLRQHVVAPSDVGVLDPSRRAILTLTTCNPPYSATTRLVVVAALVGRPAPATAVAPAGTAGTTGPTTATTTTPATTSPPTTAAPAPTLHSLTAGNANALGPAIAFGLVVVLLWVATRVLAARRRGGRKLAVLAVGVVVCALPLWLCFQQVVRILPPTV